MTTTTATLPATADHPELTYDVLRTVGEVARLFGVHPRTVATWDEAGKLASIRTPGGDRRFREADVQALLARSAK